MNENTIVLIFVLIYFSPVYYQFYLAYKESKKGNRKRFQKIRKILKWSLVCLLPIILILATLNHTNFLDYEKPIPFKRVNEISFENFRGIELFKKNLYGNERFAYVYTTLETEIQDDSLLSKALFHPSRSFVYKKNNNSVELLEHEILHFKITELFARKIKEKISNLNSPSKEEIRKIIDHLQIEENRFQKKYDYNTFHSYVFSEQKKYEKFVDSSLNSLAKYSNPKIPINEIN